METPTQLTHCPQSINETLQLKFFSLYFKLYCVTNKKYTRLLFYDRFLANAYVRIDDLFLSKEFLRINDFL